MRTLNNISLYYNSTGLLRVLLDACLFSTSTFTVASGPIRQVEDAQCPLFAQVLREATYARQLNDTCNPPKQ